MKLRIKITPIEGSIYVGMKFKSALFEDTIHQIVKIEDNMVYFSTNGKGCSQWTTVEIVKYAFSEGRYIKID